jgi:iron complex transport system ATP-binding protein
MSFLPQGPIAPEGLTVRELVAQGRFPHQTLLRQWSQEDAQAVERALDQTNLVDLAERPVSDLSGGQRQRAWIAMVLAQDTPVMLLDEPTAFLDLKVQVDLLCLLHAVARQQGRTVVLVLHDLNIAASLADRIVMMRDGAIQAEGSVAEVFTAENLKRVFELEASILTDPNTGRPMCAPVVTPFVTRTSDPAPAVALDQQEAG